MAKPIKRSLQENAPWLPPKYELPEGYALQALSRGEASPEQQQLALKWIIESAAGTYQPSYRPGVDGERETSFAEGRRYVGLHIITLLKLNLTLLRKDK